jgi:HAD superfamily hydrolase (TIGR01509 family)
VSAAAVLFDWDGTLVDSRATLLAAWRGATRAVLGTPFPDTPEEERLAWTLNGHEMLPRLTNDPATARELTGTFQRLYAASAERGVLAFVGAAELLDGLRARGRSIGVVTAKARIRYEADAARVGLADHIKIAICREDVTAPKPDPEGVQHALEAVGVQPGRAVMVGDSPQDIAAGIAAGVTPIGVAWGFFGRHELMAAGATTVAGTPDELLLMLNRHGAP